MDQDKLTLLARRILPACTHVSHVRQLTGGASKESWVFAVMSGEQAQYLLLRRLPPGRPSPDMTLPMAIEAALVQAVEAIGVPVASVRHVLTPEDRLGEGFVSDFIDGETIGRKIQTSPALAEARPQLLAHFGQALAQLHRANCQLLPSLPLLDATAHLDMYRQARRVDPVPRPVLEMALVWLADHLPPPVVPSLVHGDFRLGNLLIDGSGLRAVLDWELAHLGDPCADLGWLCLTPWRFGAVDQAVAGLGTREALLQSYAAGGGRPVSRQQLRWWEICGSLRWATMCAAMVTTFRDGGDTSVDRAMIARRASESEIDLLRLIYLDD